MIDGGLRPIFREHLREFHWQSVETGGTGLGCPDSNYCFDGEHAWIEYKQTDGLACTLRPEQVGWIIKRTNAGGKVYVATRRWHDGGPRKGPPIDKLYLHEGRWARELKTNGLYGAPAILAMDGGPRGWDWDAVRAALLGRPFGG